MFIEYLYNKKTNLNNHIVLIKEPGSINGVFYYMTGMGGEAIAATEIIIANEKVDLFRPMIFMDNQKLKNSLVGGKLSYEESLIQINTIFCTNFPTIYEFSTRPAITSFDLQEYNQIFHEKGCVRFAADDFDYNPHDSDTVY